MPVQFRFNALLSHYPFSCHAASPPLFAGRPASDPGDLLLSIPIFHGLSSKSVGFSECVFQSLVIQYPTHRTNGAVLDDLDIAYFFPHNQCCFLETEILQETQDDYLSLILSQFTPDHPPDGI
jgi:hypothetical protein